VQHHAETPDLRGIGGVRARLGQCPRDRLTRDWGEAVDRDGWKILP
jgi:hypothetical protein